MTPEVAQFSNRGMNQDISVSKATNEFAFENYNIRITAVNDNTLLSITNEKLPTPINVELKQAAIYNKLNVSLKGAFEGNTAISKLIISSEYETDTQVQLRIEVKSYESEIINLIHNIPSGIRDYEYSFTTRYKSLEDAVISSVGGYDTTISKYSYYTQFETKPSFRFLNDTSDYIPGIYLGHAIINNNLVLFTHEDDGFDYIISLQYDKTKGFVGKTHYIGNLNFSTEHPIETLPYYESELVQKVYWVDGVNQPRVINIVSDNIVERLDTQFDFNPTITEFPYVTITKEYSGVGLFPAGVIQYFISYYNKYGAETGIVWSSDLQYITEYNRAASPDEMVVCSFKIDISNVDTTYDYARVYSMQRTSLNTTPICRIVGDININNSDSITIIDTNTNTETIDPTQLLFLGGDTFIASTLAQKDDTLFLGDLTIDNIVVPQEIKDLFVFENNQYDSPYIEFSSKGVEEDLYLNQTIKTFKGGEWYRFAIQFQDNTTKWTVPIFIGDKQCLIYPFTTIVAGRYINTATIRFNKPSAFDSIVSSFGFTNYRLLIAETRPDNRKIIAQGFLNPTVFSINNRILNNGPYALGSWISRPINGNASYEHLSSLGNEYSKIDDEEIWTNLETCEIQNTIKESPILKVTSSNYIIDFHVGVGSGVGYYVANIWAVEDKGDTIIPDIDTTLIASTVISTGTTYSSPVYNDTAIYRKLVEFYKEHLPEISLNGLDEQKWLDYVEGVYRGTWNSGNIKDFALIEDTDWSSGGFWNSNGSIVKLKNQEGNGYIAKAYTYISTSLSEKTYVKDKNGYYVDSSVVTLHSPELDNVSSLVETSGLKLNIIGVVPINNTYSDIIINTSTSSLKPSGGLVKSFWDNSENKALINAALYQDFGWNYDGTLNKGYTYNYYVYLWNKKGSIIGQTADSKYILDEQDKFFDSTNAELQHKVIATRKTSSSTNYFNKDNFDSYDILPSVFDSTEVTTKRLYGFDKDIYYQGNVDIVVPTVSKGYKVFWKDVYGKNVDGYTELTQLDPVSIKYKKPKHMVFNLKKGSTDNYILPSLNDELKWSLNKLYSDTEDSAEIPWLSTKEYFQNTITDPTSPSVPYLYLAELYRDVDSSILYGNADEETLVKHNWIPITTATSIDNNITKVFGDTYYQRWECLNTVPFTEEDLNSVVDIVSFMVETHVNLEGRYDKNKDSLNILNARPDNFNKINPVYSQTNNYFTYNILDEKFNQNKYFNQVAFSLQKTSTSEIDTWCNISLASAFNLDGKYGKLNKLITVNDAIIAFQDKALSVINFNNRTALSTESGVPIEIANSGKVNGYSVISSNVGCQNKLSICEASSGVYFIDDLNKTMYGFNRDGLSNISSKGMSIWFKKNLTGEEKCFYDKLTNDVYITNDNDCLVYNEALDAFTSYMDYNHIHSLFNFEGKSILLDKNNNNGTIDPKLMFAGDYTNNYYIQYKINPEPLTDKTFTNIEFIADKLNDDSIDSITSKKNLLYPFTEFEVWNEYQYGITNLTKGRTYPNFERKFRIWRADIPRDESNGRDRIRNPWIYLKLNNKDNNNAKMAFHSFLVKYYK